MTDWPPVSFRLVVVLIRPQHWDLELVLEQWEASAAGSILSFFCCEVCTNSPNSDKTL